MDCATTTTTTLLWSWLTAGLVGATLLLQFGLNRYDVYDWRDWYKRIDGYPDADTTGPLFGIAWSIVYSAQAVTRFIALGNACGDAFVAFVILFLVDSLLNNLWVFAFMGGWLRCNCMGMYAKQRALIGFIIITFAMANTITITILTIVELDSVSAIVFSSIPTAWIVLATAFNGVTASREADYNRVQGKVT
jgi:hypothetical protein